ncbi:MAG: EF-hand domain-containing protein [Hydrogenophaga sp.]|nr:EF-hand domain-containing protein [Hydrogenophaga sp.]
MSRSPQHHVLSAFEHRSLALLAGITLGLASVSAFAQSTAAPASPEPSTSSSTSGASDAKAAFAKADTNGDGKLSKDEAAMLPAISANFDKADANKDGSLSASEFAKALKM